MKNGVDRNVEALRGVLELLARIHDDVYARPARQLGLQAAGSHLRHALEFYACFDQGLPVGRIDYDARPREAELETQRPTAIARIEAVIASLSAYEVSELQTLEIHQDDSDPARWTTSTVGRELQFLAAHLVHHLALVAVILRHHGVDVPERFGVAPSTLVYWKASGARAV